MWRQFPAPLSLCGLEHGTDLSISTSWCAGQGRPHRAGSPNWVMFFLPDWTITAASVFKVRTVLAGRCLPGTTHFQFLPLCLAWPGSREGGGRGVYAQTWSRSGPRVLPGPPPAPARPGLRLTAGTPPFSFLSPQAGHQLMSHLRTCINHRTATPSPVKLI